MPWTGETFTKHNRGLSPAQSTHAAHIANAMLGRGAPEGLAIATANKLVHRDGGGMVPAPHMDPSQAVLFRGVADRLASMPPDALRDLIPRLGDSPVAEIARDILQQKSQGDPMPRGQQPAEINGAMTPRVSGGRADGMRPKEDTVSILAAGGEFVISPHHVARLGGGDIGEGHRRLDKWVVETRKKIVDKMKSLKPPARS